PGERCWKKLMARVRPGVELVRATLSPTSELMTLDLPTLERPRKAISGRVGRGNWAASVADAMKRDRTLMLKFATRERELASEAQTINHEGHEVSRRKPSRLEFFAAPIIWKAADEDVAGRAFART